MNYSQKLHNLFLGITQIIPRNYINLSIFTCFVYLFFSSTVPTKFPDFLNNFNPQSWKQQQKSKKSKAKKLWINQTNWKHGAKHTHKQARV